MNESMLNLLINLFDPITSDTQSYTDEIGEQLVSALLEQDPDDIERAVTWLKRFRAPKLETVHLRDQRGHTHRVLTAEEQKHISAEAWIYLCQIYQSGVIDMATREHVLDCVMMIDTHEVSLDQIKWIALMSFINQNAFDQFHQRLLEMVDQVIELQSD